MYRSLAEGGETVKWSIIQPKLGNVKAHVLLLLDCCFAAQAARASNHAIAPNMELIAASAMNIKTIGPSPSSFTARLIHHIKAELASTGYAEISNIANILIGRNSGFNQTPVHVLGLKTTIRLEPFNKNPGSMCDPNREVPYFADVFMTAYLHGRLDEESTARLLAWLKAYPAKIVAKLTVEDVVQSTNGPHQLLLDKGSESSGPRLERLQTPAEHDVLAAWNRFSKALTRFTRMLRSSPSISSATQNEGEVQKDAKIEAQSILLDLDDAFMSLRRVVQLSVMELPDPHSQKEALQKVFKDVTMKQNSAAPPLLEHCSNEHLPSWSDNPDQLDHPGPSSVVHSAPFVGEGPKGKGKAVAAHSRDTEQPLAHFESKSTSTHHSMLWSQKPLSKAPLDKGHSSEDLKSVGMPALHLIPSGSSTREPSRTTSQSTSLVSTKQLSQDSTANLFVAAREGNARIVKMLLSLKPNVGEVEPESGLPALLIAAKYRNTDVCRELLTSEHTKVNIHAKDCDGRNVLHLALSDNGKEDLVPLLLEHGADSDAQDKDGKTPLHYCVELDKRHAARSLLDSNAATEFRSQMEETPLSLAVRIGRRELVKVLLSSGAKIYDTDWPQASKDIVYEMRKHQKNLSTKPRTLRKR